MDKPVITRKALPAERGFDFGVKEFFIDGKSIGKFEGWAEDGSAFSVDKVFRELHARGIVAYRGSR